MWLFPHLHNALCDNVAAGLALAPDQYMRCWAGVQARLFTESQILQGFIREQSINLGAVPSETEIQGSGVLCLVGGRRDHFWRRHDGLAAILSRDRSRLAVNPIYRTNNHNGAVRLQMAWPSRMLKAECANAEEYLPRECTVDGSLLDRLNKGVTTEQDGPAIEGLVRSFVLVHLPPNYGCPGRGE